MKSYVSMTLLLSCAFTGAQEHSATSSTEIAHLFERLQTSGCQFQRNGSWHDGKKAAMHLRKKYVYLLARELVPTTESFIERAGTKSSFSGKPYSVRCKGQAEVASRVWFTEALLRWRKPPR